MHKGICNMNCNWIKENEDVFYTTHLITTVCKEDIDILKKNASTSKRKQSRLCTHLSSKEDIHEMLIVHSKGNYVRPHKHLDKTESFHIIEGKLRIIIFDDNGKINITIKMTEYGAGGICYYRLSEPLYHTVVPVSDMVVFHETTKGPFNRSDCCFAPWAPHVGDSACSLYLENLLNIHC